MEKDPQYNQYNLHIRTNNGPIFGGTSNFYGNPPQDAQPEPKQDAEPEEAEADECEPLALDVANYSEWSIYQYIVDKEHAAVLLSWMRREIAGMKGPKLKLKVMRAMCRADVFNSSIPHKVYCETFGEVAKSRYSEWMGSEMKYDTYELDVIYEQYLAYLAKKVKR